MPQSPQYGLSASLAALSTVLWAIAMGRQLAWHAPLSKWLCEPQAIPPIPGAMEAIQAAVHPMLLLAVAASFVLFAVASRHFHGFKAILWLPPIALHFGLRLSALFDSDEHWGFCGLRDDPFVVYVALDLATIFFVFIYAGFIALISSAATKLFPGPGSSET